MKNPRITAKERGLIKGALRRVFSRSDLRKQIISASIIDYRDEARPRVKKWSKCASCGESHPTYLMDVDHINPVVPINSSLEEMSADDLVNNLWCEENNLRVIDKQCHNKITSVQTKLRAKLKKEKKGSKK